MEVNNQNGLNSQKSWLENIDQIDFKKIFLERLESIEPIPEEYRKDQASRLEFLGIKRLKREAPVLVFLLQTENTGEFRLWLTNPKDVRNKHMPHIDAEKELADFLGISIYATEFPKYIIAGFLLQDESGLLCLLLDDVRSGIVNTVMEGDWGDRRRKSFLDLLQSYGMSKVAGKFPTEYGYKDKILADEDLIGERREDLMLLEVAQKYKMTNTQYMRFRIKAKGAIDAVKKNEIEEDYKAGILKNIEEIAQEVVDEDKE